MIGKKKQYYLTFYISLVRRIKSEKDREVKRKRMDDVDEDEARGRARQSEWVTNLICSPRVINLPMHY